MCGCVDCSRHNGIKGARAKCAHTFSHGMVGVLSADIACRSYPQNISEVILYIVH